MTNGTIEHVNGFLLLRGLIGGDDQNALIAACHAVAAAAPFITPTMTDGRPFRVAMTNAGEWGWLSDRDGYRYARHHPQTGRGWPAAPAIFSHWARAAVATAVGVPTAKAYQPQCYLINRYAAGRGRLGLHRDEDERDRSQPIVILSLGVDAVFLAGGATRRDAVARLTLHSGDVVVMAGAARMAYHGIDRLLPTLDAPFADRLSVTIRRVDPVG